MSQSDMVISDQPGASFLTDLNAVIAALTTNSSGATQPSTTYAYQWWADTTAGILKQRNAANDGWVSLLNLATGAPVVADSLPAGSVIFYAKNTAPTGYLKANGALVSRTTYAALFAAIGTTFGVGDGSTNFALPDLRGEFLRGWDDGRAIDSGRSFGTAQAANVGAHTHGIPALDTSGGAFNSTTAGSGSITYASTTTGSNPTGETRPRNIALLACIKF